MIFWPIGALLSSRCPSACSSSQLDLANAHGRSWVHSVDPKQWRTEHVNIQGMPWPIGFATPKQSCQIKIHGIKATEWSGARQTIKMVRSIQDGTNNQECTDQPDGGEGEGEIAPGSQKAPWPGLGSLSDLNRQKYVE